MAHSALRGFWYAFCLQHWSGYRKRNSQHKHSNTFCDHICFTRVADLPGIRNAFKRHKFAVTSDSDVFEEMDRRSRQSNLQALLARFPNLEQSFAWIDEQLMMEHRARYIWIALEQEWCCEDKNGREEMPCCCRPSRVAFRAENENRSFQIDEYQAGQY